MKKYPQRTFRPWEGNEEHLRTAEQLGFSVSELINEVLEEHFYRHLQARSEKMRRVLSSSTKGS